MSAVVYVMFSWSNKSLARKRKEGNRGRCSLVRPTVGQMLKLKEMQLRSATEWT